MSSSKIHFGKYANPLWLISVSLSDSSICQNGELMYYHTMTKIYFSASEFFTALNAKLKPGAKLSMRTIEKETHISRYQLAKLRDGLAVRVSQEMVEKLYQFSQTYGVKIPAEKIVKIVTVPELDKP